MFFIFFFIAVSMAIEVNLMLPLDAVTSSGVNGYDQFKKDFQKLKSAGVAGVMCDIWWGIVETSSGSYKWDGYKSLVALVKECGLKFQAVMSFHKCGGNVGDTVTIEIPSWVRSAGSSAGSFFKDPQGNVNNEYIAFGADGVSLSGRTPIQIYKAFMQSFKDNFASYINDGTINEIQVGMGPCGETRYPSYPGSHGYQYCGIGEFECSDKYSLAKLASAASAAGHSDWGYASPNNAGTYNSRPPSSTGFFGNGNDNYASEYGKFFLNWYAQLLLDHTNDVLSVAKSVFGSLAIAGKVSGIHWWYTDASHAAEVTAGYYNSNGRNAYLDICNVFKKYGARLDFTCLEMTGTDSGCGSHPTALVDQAYQAANSAGIKKCGENALELCGYGGCNTGGFDQIVKQSKWYGLTAFTYLRMTRALLDDGTAWSQFKNFVSQMNSF